MKDRQTRARLAAWLAWSGALVCLAAFVLAATHEGSLLQLVIAGVGAVLAAVTAVTRPRNRERGTGQQLSPMSGSYAWLLGAGLLDSLLDDLGVGSLVQWCLMGVALAALALGIAIYTADLRDDPDRCTRR